MASPAVALLLSLLVVSDLFFHPSSAVVTVQVSHQLVDALCKETQNYEFCKTSLNNYPRTGKADMNELSIIAVLLATAQARLNKYFVDQLFQNAQDPLTKDRLANCLTDYTVTLGKLQLAYRLSYKKDYKGMTKWVSDAMKMTTKCGDRFNKPPSCPSPIADYNQKMIWLNNIALVVLDLLEH